MGMTETIDAANKLRRKKDTSQGKSRLQPKCPRLGKERDHPLRGVSRAGPPLAPVARVGKLRHTGFAISSTAEAGVRPQNLMLASPALGRGLVGSGAWGAHSPVYTLGFLPGDLLPLPPQGPPLATGPWTTDPSIAFPPRTSRSSRRVSRAKEGSQAAWRPSRHHAGPQGPWAQGSRTHAVVGCQGTHLTLVLPGTVATPSHGPGDAQACRPRPPPWSADDGRTWTRAARPGSQGHDTLPRTRRGCREPGQAWWTWESRPETPGTHAPGP